jgi:NADH/NAD ratio-sensing transcriptional regulator Rex
MSKFLDTYDQPKLSKEDINHLSRSITSNEIERVIKSLPKRICQDLADSLLNSTIALKKN